MTGSTKLEELSKFVPAKIEEINEVNKSQSDIATTRKAITDILTNMVEEIRKHREAESCKEIFEELQVSGFPRPFFMFLLREPNSEMDVVETVNVILNHYDLKVQNARTDHLETMV